MFTKLYVEHTCKSYRKTDKKTRIAQKSPQLRVQTSILHQLKIKFSRDANASLDYFINFLFW